jgi:uncharacterized membrane protein YoaK (UPF0700 family)
MKTHSKQFERLRVALLMTTVSGFVNAYSYLLFDKRFAGAQTGNVILLGMSFAELDWHRIWQFSIPIMAFSFGQAVSYCLRRFARKFQISHHILGLRVILGILLATLLLLPLNNGDLIVASLALFSSIQLDIFSHIGEAPYANVMMTGNVKNGAYFLAKGLAEHHKTTVEHALHKYYLIVSFMIGVAAAVWMVKLFGIYSLISLVFPLIVLHQWFSVIEKWKL